MELLAHSPLGASGAGRWMICAGSVTQSKGCPDLEDEHATLGIGAHEIGAMCLKRNSDAWIYSGTTTENGTLVDEELTNAVQVYVDDVRRCHPERDQGNFWVERRFHCPDIHPLFYGTADATYLDAPARHLHVHDYKHGAGVIVEVQHNWQTMYYAVGALTELGLWSAVDAVTLHIAQPRGFHFDGPLRYWTISTADLMDWLYNELIPGMNRALTSNEVISGEHCRFCPARGRACPALMNDLEELHGMVEANTPAAELSNEQLGRFMDLVDRAKLMNGAYGKDAFNRINAGHKVPGQKLVKAKKNRVWRAEAAAALEGHYGDEAFIIKELKSPNQIEALPRGDEFAAAHAYKPEAGYALAKDSDSRMAVTSDSKSMFQPVKKSRRAKK